jgi:nicotinamide riboside kinase
LPEFARSYLDGRLDYAEADLERIARGQLAGELALVAANHPVAVLDTDLIVIQVWWQEKYGRVPTWVTEHLRRQAPREYLLAKPDLPWQPDPLRESPADRDRLFGVYRATLDAYGYAFTEIAGEGDARYRLAAARVRRRSPSPS